MLYNAKGLDILNNTVTPATFGGLPMIACSTNYNDTFPATAWSSMLQLAAAKGCPAFHIDYAHDGANAAATLRAALLNVQRFYSASGGVPWKDTASAQTPPIGPLFFFQFTPLITSAPDFTAVNTGAYIARQLAESCLNFRRNHRFGVGCDGVWLVLGENLDRIQRPPIYTWRSDFTDPTFWSTRLPGAWWASGRPPSISDAIFSQRTLLAAGVARLLSLEPTYPGISRHFYPPLLTPDSGTRLFVLEHN